MEYALAWVEEDPTMERIERFISVFWQVEDYQPELAQALEYLYETYNLEFSETAIRHLYDEQSVRVFKLLSEQLGIDAATLRKQMELAIEEAKQ